MNIESYVDDLLFRMKEYDGIDAKVTYHISASGEIVSFEITIIGYTN